MTAIPMHTTARSISAATTNRTRWASRIMTGVVVLFLTFDVVVKFMNSPEAVAGTAQLGWSPASLPTLGAIGAVCLILYVIPRTALLGALLWTGYLGGAVATHLRVGNPLFTHTLFPIYVAALLWGALYLRDARVRALVRSAR